MRSINTRLFRSKAVSLTLTGVLLVLAAAVSMSYRTAGSIQPQDEAQVLGATAGAEEKATQESDDDADKKTKPASSETKEATDQTNTQIQADTSAVNAAPPVAADPAPQPVAQPAPTPVVSNYPADAVGSTMNSNPTTRSMLSQMGMSESWLWSRGVKILPYNGPVKKRCALNSSVEVAGIAVKSNAIYPSCPNGQEVIYPEYRTPGKCTVVYNWTNFGGSKTAFGNSYAVLAHEIAHCLHFLYGEGSAFQNSYISQVRPELASIARTGQREIIADDFMICRMASDTSWGRGYFDTYNVSRLSASKCAQANRLFGAYFGV